MTLRHRAAVAAVALALTATACGSEDLGSEEKKETAGPKDRIEVTGEFGAKPTVKIDAPLKFEESTSWTSEVGEGDKVGAAATAILQLTLANGRTGKTAVSTGDPGQNPLSVTLDQIFPVLAKALTGKPAHSRVLVAATADDTFGDKGSEDIGIRAGDPVVLVADILSTDATSVLDGPTGTTRAAPATAPVVQEKDGLPAELDFTKARKPGKLTVVTLREGTGPVVERPERVTADYVGQVWGARKPFEETFTTEPSPFTIGLGAAIKAWDEALVGKKEGARVMVIAPPAVAYGSRAQPNIPANSTLVFVVDVLGVG